MVSLSVYDSNLGPISNTLSGQVCQAPAKYCMRRISNTFVKMQQGGQFKSEAIWPGSAGAQATRAPAAWWAPARGTGAPPAPPPPTAPASPPPPARPPRTRRAAVGQSGRRDAHQRRKVGPQVLRLHARCSTCPDVHACVVLWLMHASDTATMSVSSWLACKALMTACRRALNVPRKALGLQIISVAYLVDLCSAGQHVPGTCKHF